MVEMPIGLGCRRPVGPNMVCHIYKNYLIKNITFILLFIEFCIKCKLELVRLTFGGSQIIFWIFQVVLGEIKVSFVISIILKMNA